MGHPNGNNPHIRIKKRFFVGLWGWFCYPSIRSAVKLAAHDASDDWRKGARERIMALMENYTDVVLELDEVTAQGLRG